MAGEEKTKLRLEIAHVLFVDIVGYSKLLIDEQSEALQELNAIVRNTEAAKTADEAGQLIFLPTGDGMALVFTGSVEDPVECALQISHKLRAQPSLPIRMGIHSGPVHHVSDVNQRDNIAGAGINIAQRVMDCGDAGHILVSKRVADDLSQYRRWQPYLHELGDFEVKHGVVVSVVNLYADIVGNPNPPERLKGSKRIPQRAKAVDQPRRSLMPLIVGGLMVFALIALALVFTPAILKQMRSGKPEVPAATSSPSPAQPQASAVSTAGPEKSIAVLPFDNLSDNKENAFFTDGVQDEILTNLAKIADLKVISRSSVMQYKAGVQRNLRKIGEELGVAHLLEGSVQRSANKVRVNAQLIDARNDAHLWAQTYDRDLADVFAIQSDIAKAIADQLQARLSPTEKSAIEQRPTADVTAFDLYSRAKNLQLTTSFSALAGSNLRQAVNFLNQAVAHDPSFFQAYCQLAYAHDNLYFLGIDHTPARLALGDAATEAALKLRPDAGEGHFARAEHLYRGYNDYKGALAELEIARRALPNEARVHELTGYILRRQGKQEEGLVSLERAVNLDPRNFFTLQQIALSYQNLRRYPEMAAVLDRAMAIIPGDVEVRVVRALVDLDWKADLEPLRHTISAIEKENPGALERVADTWLTWALAAHDVSAARKALAALGDNPLNTDAVSLRPSVLKGLIAMMMKDRGAAHAAFTEARIEQEKTVQTQPDYGPPMAVLGFIDAVLGRKEDALREGRRALELLPVSKDSINGAHMLEYFAIIAAWAGDKELACKQLEAALQMPGTLSYGQLKLLPFWDPLRGDPRFEKIVASLAPKS
ncbi:MAG TPA: adenylate/guanylate cyclase domain-containing protein [Chthoniobacterales bacterium]|nr:adenylate/guanylate cyclase domain-containing protein [Chthoniobacterales bacterium]